MKRLLIATTNPGKLHEISLFLKDVPVELVSLKDLGIRDDVEETGITYRQNSQKKALFYAKKSGLPAVADDGGLEIDALAGAPGVLSRRWLGFEATDEELIDHLRKVVRKLPENRKTACFKTVVSFALPDGRVWSMPGKVDGIISKEPSQNISKGYPYRSFFYLPKIKKFYFETELTEDEQKRYNHRYKAIEKLKPIIKNHL